MADVVIRERTDEKEWIHRMEIPLKTFLREYDFEAVVRCKDCKYADEYARCGLVKWYNNEDDYCSRGERREDEQQE